MCGLDAIHPRHLDVYQHDVGLEHPPQLHSQLVIARLAHDEREIANYTRAIGRGHLASVETALQAELAQLDGNQQTAVLQFQLTPAAVAQHLQGLIEKLLSRVTGKVREPVQQSIVRILWPSMEA